VTRRCAWCEKDTAHRARTVPGVGSVRWECCVCETPGDVLTQLELEAVVRAQIKPRAEHPVPRQLPTVYLECTFDKGGVSVLRDAVVAHYACVGAPPVVGEPLQRRPVGEAYAVPYGKVQRVSWEETHD